jgi:preprotein translocase subunit SecD
MTRSVPLSRSTLRVGGGSAFFVRRHPHTTKIHTMKKIIHLISGCLIAVAAVAADSSTSQVFQMRLVADQPSSETEQMTLVQTWHGKEQKEVLFVQKTALLDQTDLKSATVSTNAQMSTPQIDISFTDKGTKRFAEVTRQNIGKRLAIIIGGQIYSAPHIQAEITSGDGQITGSFSEQEARDLAAKISKTLQK